MLLWLVLFMLTTLALVFSPKLVRDAFIFLYNTLSNLIPFDGCFFRLDCLVHPATAIVPFILCVFFCWHPGGGGGGGFCGVGGWLAQANIYK